LPREDWRPVDVLEEEAGGSRYSYAASPNEVGRRNARKCGLKISSRERESQSEIFGCLGERVTRVQN
jgi:hypothetical protein